MISQEQRWLLEEKYEGEETKNFHTDCARLDAGEPLAYVIGYVSFLECLIYLDHRPLIPRPETEWWTEKAIANIAAYQFSPKLPPIGIWSHRSSTNSHQPTVRGETSNQVTVLDLCAGSGAIGIAVAKHIPQVAVDFCEIDPLLVTTIERNIAANLTARPTTSPPHPSSRSRLELDSLSDSQTIRLQQHRVIEADLFSPAQDPSSRRDLKLGKPRLGRYDFILTNPPYINPALDRVQTSVKNFEPYIALYGGIAGMEIIDRIITGAPAHLTPKGQLWVEHEPEQVAAITATAHANGFSITPQQDQYGVDRYSILVLE